MPKGPVKTIRELINNKTLREKDAQFALKYLNDGDIDSLKELVDSAYVLTVKHQKKSSNDEYSTIDIDLLDDLRIYVNEYFLLVGGTIDEDDESQENLLNIDNLEGYDENTI